ncbi:MAG: glycosyltransferase, partial [Acidimicrobiales bacterium]|nr:glycosyltransferase [Acidimicrobiales bacterium]
MNDGPNIRVVLCAPGFPTSIDDADKPFLLNHGKALSLAGIQVTVVCPMVNGMPSRQQLGDIEVIRVRYAPRRMQTLASTGSMYREATGLKSLLVVPMLLSLTATTVRQLRRKKTVAYGHWWVPGGLVAVIAAFITRRPSVVYLHGSDAAITTTKTLRMIASVVMRMADSRIAVSDELASWGESISRREFTILPMPIDLERLPLPSPAPQDGLI